MRGKFAIYYYPYLTGYLAAWAEANLPELKRAAAKCISSAPPIELQGVSGSARLLAAPPVRLALPAPSVRPMLPAPRKCIALPAAHPTPLLMTSPRAPMLPAPPPQRFLLANNSRNRRHCFAARHYHTVPRPITCILDLMDPGERRLYEILLEKCETNLLASMTMQRDEPLTVTIGRSELIPLWLESKYGSHWKTDAASKEAVKAGKVVKIEEAIKTLVERARKGIKDASKGLCSKMFVEVIHPTADVYRKEITYRVYVSQQVLKHLHDAGAVHWRAEGPGRILMYLQAEDVPGQSSEPKRPKM